MHNEPNNTCSNTEGSLPGKCAGMVFPYIAMQEECPKVYDQTEALENGTLFPGLRLPFHREIKARNGNKSGPLCELMALDFAIVELGLYLDTHKNDKEAYELFRKYVDLYQNGREKYLKTCGPLKQMDAANFERYNWLDDPWPWNYDGGNK